MKTMVVSKVKDLDAPIRQWVRGLFGRELDEEEQITVMAFSPHPAPSPDVARAAAARMDRVLDRAAQNMKNVSADEFEAAVDEAMTQVRRREP